MPHSSSPAHSKVSDSLRERAEAHVRKFRAGKLQESVADTAALVEDLTIHQVELEMQGAELKNALLQVEESQQLYFQFFRNAPVPIFLVNADRAIAGANLAAEEMLRQGSDGHVEKLDLAFALLLSQKSAAKWQSFLDALAQDSSFARTELEMTFPEGGRRFYALTGCATVQGKFLIYFQDVTEMRAREEELTILRSAIEQCPAVVVLTDAKARITFANPAFTEQTGYALSEVLGKNPRVLKSGLMPRGYYADLWKKLEAMETWSGEFSNRRKDGSIYWEWARLAPVLDASEKLLGYIGVKQDITAQKEWEQKLRKHQLHLEVLVDMAAKFIHSSLDQMEELVLEALGLLAKALEADRAFVVGFNPKTQTLSLSQEWCAEGIPASLHQVQQAPFSDYADFVPALVEGEVVEIPLVRDLPDDSPSKAHLQEQGIQSLLAGPLYEDGVVLGSVGLDFVRAPRDFDESDRQLVRMFGHLLAGVLRRKQTTSALQEKDRQQKLLLNNSPSMIYQLSPEGVVLDCSGSVTGLLGWKVEEVIGKNASQFVFQKDLSLYEQQMRETMRDKKILSAFRYRLLDRNGEPRWFRTMLAPVFDEAGELLYLVGNSSDVSQLQALAEEIDRFSLLTRWTANAVIFTDAERRIVWVNPAFEAATGYTLAEVLGRSPSLQHGPETSVECLQRMREALDRGDRFIEEVLHYHRDGHPYWVKLEVIPHYDSEGDLKGFVSVQTDITRIRQREQELRAVQAQVESALAQSVQANQAKEDFLATMSHEVRTPLNAMLGLSRVLGETPLDYKQQRLLSLLRNNGELLLSIVNDVLDFAKIESGRLELVCEPFSLEQTLADFCENLSLRAKDKGLRCTWDISPQLPKWVEGDAGRLLQILHNLGSNALKFTLQGGIHITAFPVGGNHIRLAVHDTGIGIAEEKRPILFQRFEQLDSGITRQFGGTGLGLAICKQLVQLMGGEIGVDGAEGGGSEFWFTVPLVAVCTPENLLDTAQVPEVKLGGRLLVVEDYEPNRIVLEEMLKLLHLTCTFAEDGQTALEILASAPFDLVLMDIQMPGMDGRECTQRIRAGAAGERNRHVPIVALTAHVQDTERQLCRDAGMQDYLTKPIDLEDLARCLGQWLSHKEPSSGGALESQRHPGYSEEEAEELCFDPDAMSKALGGRRDFVVRYFERYRQSAEEDLRSLREAVEIQEWATVRKFMHTMLGACGYLQAPQVEQAMKSLQTSARKSAASEAFDALMILERELQRFFRHGAKVWLGEE